MPTCGAPWLDVGTPLSVCVVVGLCGYLSDNGHGPAAFVSRARQLATCALLYTLLLCSALAWVCFLLWFSSCSRSPNTIASCCCSTYWWRNFCQYDLPSVGSVRSWDWAAALCGPVIPAQHLLVCGLVARKDTSAVAVSSGCGAPRSRSYLLTVFFQLHSFPVLLLIGCICPFRLCAFPRR